MNNTKAIEKVYVLSKRVDNPDSDRRYKGDWRREAGWNKGEVFKVLEFNVADFFGLSKLECEDIGLETTIKIVTKYNDEYSEGLFFFLYGGFNLFNSIHTELVQDIVNYPETKEIKYNPNELLKYFIKEFISIGKTPEADDIGNIIIKFFMYQNP